MILQVAGEAVDLVDDDRVDVALLGDALEHLLEGGTVGGTRRLAAIDVLVNELPALRADVAHARLALRGDGEALLAFALFDLLARRHAEIDHRSHGRPPFFESLCRATDRFLFGPFPSDIGPSDLHMGASASRSARTCNTSWTRAWAKGRSCSDVGIGRVHGHGGSASFGA